METKIINGNELAQEVIQDTLNIKNPDYKYRLGVVFVGDSEASKSFIRKKEEMCEKVGVKLMLFTYPKEISTRKLRLELAHLQKIRNLDGLIVQLPLPKHINADRILDGVQPEKDVDCLCSKNIGKFVKAQQVLESPIVLSIKKVLKSHDVETKGKRILVIGAGRLIGKPVASYFTNNKNTVIVVDNQEKNLSELTRLADIIVIGVGKRGILKNEDVKEGVVLIDCGFSLDEEGNVQGDIDAQEFEGIASLISPVPNGIGPLTTAFLVKNVMEAGNVIHNS